MCALFLVTLKKGSEDTILGKNIKELNEVLKGEKKVTIDGEDKTLDNKSIVITHEGDNIFKISSINDVVDKSKILGEASFHKTIMEKGWDKLSLSLPEQKEVSPFLQFYLGGYIEGRITFNEINNFLDNTQYNSIKQDPTLKTHNAIKSFFNEVNSNMISKLNTFSSLSTKDQEYYYKIYLFFSQLHGLLRGYNYEVDRRNKSENKYKPTTIEELLFIQADGEVPELQRYFYYKLKGIVYKLGSENYFRNVFNMPTEDPKSVWRRFMWHSRCSAMIKLTKDESGKISDLLSGHTAWTDYSETLRTYKQYLI
jgi:hypothetical protein